MLLRRPLPQAIVFLAAFWMVAAMILVSPAHSQNSTLRNYKLGGNAPPFLDVLTYDGDFFIPKVQISPDGKYVVFWADYSTDGAHELYSVPLNGSAQPVRISNLHTADMTGDFHIAADSSRVVYWINQQGSDTAELNSVPIGGGAVTKLSDAYLAPNKIVSGRTFDITADSAHVIYYRGNAPTALFSVPTAGGTEIRLSPLSKTVDVGTYRVSMDGENVVFRMETDNPPILSVPSGGGPIVTLADESSLGESLGYFLLSPDGSTVYYIVRRKLLFPPREALYRVPTAGGDAELIDSDLTQYEDNFLRLVVSPDNQYVAVAANYFENGAEIFSVPASGGPKTPLHSSPLQTIYTVYFDPSSSHAVYGAVSLGEAQNDLFTVPVTGGAEVQLDLIGGNMQNFRISPSGEHIAYRAGFAGEPENLFGVPLTGGQPQMLNTPMPGNAAGIYAYAFTPQGYHVVYHADQQAQGVYELYIVPIAGGQPTKLNAPLATGGIVYPGAWAISPDGRTVVYVADQEISGKKELYATFLGAEVYLPHVGRSQ